MKMCCLAERNSVVKWLMARNRDGMQETKLRRCVLLVAFSADFAELRSLSAA